MYNAFIGIQPTDYDLIHGNVSKTESVDTMSWKKHGNSSQVDNDMD